MTELEKLEANEYKLTRHSIARGKCEVCGKAISLDESHLSHRIPKHKKYIKKYGKTIIHHPFNLALTCSRCNSSVLLAPATHPVEAEKLVHTILAEIRR